ncbi:MAG: HD domain-containing phosphohydrolase [Burkholderiales bacterium]
MMKTSPNPAVAVLAKDAVHNSELEALRASESRYRRVFETARDGILLLNAETAQIEDVNPYLINMLGYSHTEFLGKKLWEVGPFVDIKECKGMFLELQAKGYVRYENLPLRTADGANIEVEFVSNTYDCEGIKVIQCNVRNITDRRITEKKLEQHKQLYAALSQCNKAIVHCASEEELFSEVCRAAVQFGGMKMAWIGLIDPESRMVRPIVSFGDGTDHLGSLKLSMDADNSHGGGPTCIAISENRPYWCQDLLNDPATSPWRELIQRADWAASASLPLRRNGAVIGSFILYSGEINAFDELVRNLLAEMAADISFALDAFDHESQRKLAEEGLHEAEEQFRGLVEQSIVGIYIIQDEKFTYANPRLAGIMGLDSAKALVGSDPPSWIVEADRTEVARNIRRLLRGEVQNLALEFGVLRLDGVEIRVGTNVARATQRGKVAIIGVAQDISEKKRAEEKILDYVEQLKTTLNGTIEVVEIISEMRDPYTAGHERRVAQIAVGIATELGLDAHQLEGLQVASNLHDVGKIMIPAEILSKPSKLTAIEYALVQGHVQAGYEVLKNVKFPWPVAQVVLQHHERMDGSGYPQGLKGEAILFEARIIAVADVVEAMSSHRPYRAGLNMEAALGEIERNKGVKYDAKVVDACLKLFREKGYTISG